jgi:hypothetical protein
MTEQTTSERRRDYPEILKRIESIEETLRGNGKDGLMVQVALIKQESLVISSKIDDIESKLSDITCTINELRLGLEVERRTRAEEKEQKIDFRFIVEHIIIPIAIPLIGGAIWATIYISINAKGGIP